jgi:hypothetical protein
VRRTLSDVVRAAAAALPRAVRRYRAPAPRPLRPPPLQSQRDGVGARQRWGIPYGRQPIEGGYEEDGSKLYHAAARIGNVVVPGKTGPHLVRTLLSGVSIWLSLVDMNDAREEQAWRLVTENT